MAMKQSIQDIILETLSSGILDSSQRDVLKEGLIQQMAMVEDGFTITFTDISQDLKMDMNFFTKEIEEVVGVDQFGYQLMNAMQAASHQGLEICKPLTRLFPFKLTGEGELL